MCKGQMKNDIPAVPATRKLLLTSLESFGEDSNGRTPSDAAKLFTIGVFVLFLTALEQIVRQILISYSYLHPLLEVEVNRHILARHLGVDAVGCWFIAYYGFKGRHILNDMVDTVIRGKKNAMPKAFDNRLFKYHPEAARCIVLFLGYTAKNSVDTLIWNDGALFVAHHILAFFTAWGALFPGSAHYYSPFFLGFSETSSFALCLLANFDDDFGVKGLGSAFPLAKVLLGAVFAVLFILCRVFIWSVVTYYYVRDLRAVLKTDDPRLLGRKTWFKFTGVAITFLTLLQIIWLGEIFNTGYKEMKALGFL